ncbi:LOW QUALITY PROTEIN: Putative membrane protein insertion efficiency factor [Frankliniella fusca]|uniref:Membrane protein insertion efficiency factor n=1 Tax=Frankliniella fusca TaxID=407009 RepID=A0AAE1HMY0_9NEOP|nr:LOW QUALITY PROTEIN: Putative membrane protein insertion efficiency factor [Frankliniella fusca]
MSAIAGIPHWLVKHSQLLNSGLNTCTCKIRSSTLTSVKQLHTWFHSVLKLKYFALYLDVKRILTSDAEATVNAAISRRSADEWAAQVQLRVNSVLSLFAADARYHLQCYRNFTHPRHLAAPSPSPSPCHRGRLPSLPQQQGFNELCSYIESNEECQFSLEKLGTVSWVLSDKWYAERKSDPAAEQKRLVKATIDIVRGAARGAIFNTCQYPATEQIRDGGADEVPEIVKILVTGIVGGTGKAVERKATYIEQLLVSAARPKSYISPFKHGLALLLHTRYGSRDLIRLLSSVGAVSDYADTVAFETSSAVACTSCGLKPHAFQQYVADNADYNIGTLDGHNTFHVMGMVKAVTPSTALVYPEAVAREKKKPTDARTSVSHLAKIPVRLYPAPAISGLQLL